VPEQLCGLLRGLRPMWFRKLFSTGFSGMNEIQFEVIKKEAADVLLPFCVTAWMTPRNN